MKNSFDAGFFAGNRQALLKSLGSGALVVLTAYTEMQRRSDIAFSFVQEGSFWYLTGIEDPDWRIILDGLQKKSWLVRPEPNEIRDWFDGTLSDDEAIRISGADEVIDRTEARQLLAKLRSRHSVAYTITPNEVYEQFGFTINPTQRQLTEELRPHFTVQDAAQAINKLRAIKQPQELEAIQKAINITIDGIKAALAGVKNMRYEYEFEAVTTGYFRSKGVHDAYTPTVASGANACVIHHLSGDEPLKKSNWLLFDIGASYRNYVADISRTFPLGVPTKWETAVYESIVKVHDFAISMCKPGMNVKTYLERVDESMFDELVRLGLIDKSDAPDAIRKYFPHAISHGLGIEPHDPLGKPVQFSAGMVLTVEPGIYVPEKGFGARIENDILITDDGPRNLSAKLPTSLDSLRKLML